MEGYFQKVEEAAEFLRRRVDIRPKAVMVLSGGLESFVEGMQKTIALSASEIPHFPRGRAEGHKGRLLFGRYANLPLLVLQGRTHYYEGFSPQEVVLPYFVFHALGAEILITTNAVGGVRKDLNAGDILLIEDHINFMGTSPLIGLTVQKKEDQFPSLQQAYDPSLQKIAQKVAKAEKIELKRGVYLANPGPNYETPAEIKMFRQWGADTVGMSTVFEIIAARFLKMRCLSLNIITNPSADRHTGLMQHAEVLQAMQQAQTKVVALLQGVVRELGA